VRARAIKQGLITGADHPSDREIMEFIFAPGFSTAENVTDISGRVFNGRTLAGSGMR